MGGILEVSGRIGEIVMSQGLEFKQIFSWARRWFTVGMRIDRPADPGVARLRLPTVRIEKELKMSKQEAVGKCGGWR